MDIQNNLTPFLSPTKSAERMKISGSRPAVYWMTGLSGSGKSTIASIFEKKLTKSGHAAYMIDGDTVQLGLCAGLGFTTDDRHENLRRIAELAAVIADSGQTAVVCTISPDSESRECARRIIEKKARFCEVYVKSTIDICKLRDPKGLYKKALADEIKNFTGISAPYEEPKTPDIILDTTINSAKDCAQILFQDALNGIYQPERLIYDMASAAIFASRKIMEIYSKDFGISIKSDSSPLTNADTASNEILTSIFRAKYPEYSILSEEENDSTERLTNNAGVFIIDPLDGTKEFISKNGEFCVSIGFAAQHKMKAGVIAIPTKQTLYYAFDGLGAYKISFDKLMSNPFKISLGEKLRVSSRSGRTKDELLIVTVSRSHSDKQTEILLAKNADRIEKTITVGSCLKGCYIAEGIADVHYRFGTFMKEWDTAAMQIICEEAGAVFSDIDGKPISANRADTVNRRGFIILNSAESALDTNGIE